MLTRLLFIHINSKTIVKTVSSKVESYESLKIFFTEIARPPNQEFCQ